MEPIRYIARQIEVGRHEVVAQSMRNGEWGDIVVICTCENPHYAQRIACLLRECEPWNTKAINGRGLVLGNKTAAAFV